MAVLDIAALLKPIPGADPGGPHPSQVREKDARDPTNLDKIRREAKSLPADDPMRTKLWRDGMKLAQDLFATRSKNLDWAIYAVDTATRSGGLTGAREGFQFLTKIATDGWDWIWPRPNLADVESAEPADRDSVRREQEMHAAEGRAGRFQSLDDSGSGFLFPNVLREWVIAEQDGIAISVFACRGTDGKPAKVGIEEVQSVARKIGPERIRETLAEIEGTMADLESLRQAVESRFAAVNAADLAPSFREVRTALEECRQVTDEMFASVEGDAESAEEKEGAPGDESVAGGGGGGKEKITRAGLYKQIAQIADHLSRLEPHSPVPFLLRRVLELQDLPFPQLVREFTKTRDVLAFMERSLTESPANE